MSRALVILDGANARLLATEWIAKAPTGTRLEFRGPKRTLDQNSRMWAMLTDIATQKELHGRKWNTDEWKAMFMQACGHEIRALPTLDGSGFFPWGHSSSNLSKEEMTNLIDFMLAWCAENGVVLHDPQDTTCAQ